MDEVATCYYRWVGVGMSLAMLELKRSVGLVWYWIVLCPPHCELRYESSYDSTQSVATVDSPTVISLAVYISIPSRGHTISTELLSHSISQFEV